MVEGFEIVECGLGAFFGGGAEVIEEAALGFAPRIVAITLRVMSCVGGMGIGL